MRGLSGKVLLLTIIFVMLGEVLIFLPSIANFRIQWLKGRIAQAEIAALYAAGCRYLQLDDTNLAYLCDPVMRQGAVERGDDPDELPRSYAELINAALAGRPDDLTVGIHLCRSPRCCSTT